MLGLQSAGPGAPGEAQQALKQPVDAGAGGGTHRPAPCCTGRGVDVMHWYGPSGGSHSPPAPEGPPPEVLPPVPPSPAPPSVLVPPAFEAAPSPSPVLRLETDVLPLHAASTTRTAAPYSHRAMRRD